MILILFGYKWISFFFFCFFPIWNNRDTINVQCSSLCSVLEINHEYLLSVKPYIIMVYKSTKCQGVKLWKITVVALIPTGAEKKTRTPDEEVNWTTAIHEAGHTIIGMETPTLQKHVYKVTIKSRNQSLGHVSVEVYNVLTMISCFLFL